MDFHKFASNWKTTLGAVFLVGASLAYAGDLRYEKKGQSYMDSLSVKITELKILGCDSAKSCPQPWGEKGYALYLEYTRQLAKLQKSS